MAIRAKGYHGSRRRMLIGVSIGSSLNEGYGEPMDAFNLSRQIAYRVDSLDPPGVPASEADRIDHPKAAASKFFQGVKKHG